MAEEQQQAEESEVIQEADTPKAPEASEVPDAVEAPEAPEPAEKPQPLEPAEKPIVYWGLGRRKSAVARVRLMRGTGRIIVNGHDADDYFTDERQIQAVRAPLKHLKLASRYDVLVNATGGGIGGQSGAVVLGIARALVKAEPDSEEKLRSMRLLTRDPRMKERKKYGKRSARASFQFSKR